MSLKQFRNYHWYNSTPDSFWVQIVVNTLERLFPMFQLTFSQRKGYVVSIVVKEQIYQMSMVIFPWLLENVAVDVILHNTF